MRVFSLIKRLSTDNYEPSIEFRVSISSEEIKKLADNPNFAVELGSDILDQVVALAEEDKSE